MSDSVSLSAIEENGVTCKKSPLGRAAKGTFVLLGPVEGKGARGAILRLSKEEAEQYGQLLRPASDLDLAVAGRV
ncbi:ATPase alpha subunit [Roseibium sp. TrichSKD4]|uniref:hypothetical protein n=1 Tax=Roseibium sp. TrichSKD4 TaxID=744980 RepID=UPI0001E56383|nr:hypothetical protein [Roseibium sp. TrichSKD4]EFO33901.1 ATPase alpha subunit [Roseibium sp. TrichSKD4]